VSPKTGATASTERICGIVTLDQEDERYLRQLRSTDSIGLYAGSEPVSGSGHAGGVQVTIDALNRVESVTIIRMDDSLRTPAVMVAAVEEGYRAAIRSKLVRSNSHAANGRWKVTRPVSVSRPDYLGLESRPGPEMVMPRPLEYPIHGRQAKSRRPVEGLSRNQCVRVVLSPSGPLGDIDIDISWLSHATASNIGRAISESFQDAYSKRKKDIR
jgi:hypothetical protein